MSDDDVFSPFPLEHSPGYWFNRLARELNLLLHQEFKRAGHDVTAQQWAVLNKLWEEQGMHQAQLAEKTIKDRHTMTRMLVVMEKRGWIERRPDDSDGRLIRIFLTSHGQNLKKQLIPIAKRTLDRLFMGIQSVDLASMKRVFSGIAGNINKMTKGDG